MVLPINARPKWAHWSAWKRYKSRSAVVASGATGIIVRTASATTPELHALDPTRAGRDDASRQTDVSNMGRAPGGAGAEPPLDPLIDVLKEMYPPNGDRLATARNASAKNLRSFAGRSARHCTTWFSLFCSTGVGTAASLAANWYTDIPNDGVVLDSSLMRSGFSALTVSPATARSMIC